jgi:hypothetical protein
MVTQNGKMLVHTLLFMGACLIHPSPLKATQEALRVNEKAVSRVLNKTRLAKLGEAWPAWKTPPMTWPTEEEIAKNSVQVDPSVKDNCIKWLSKFMKDESCAKALESHLVAMAKWGLFWERTEKEPLCDVFICRFVQGSYVVHIQESPADVVISVADERLADNPKPPTAHGEFIAAMASTFLHKDIVPDRERYWFQFEPKATPDGGAITRVQWNPPFVVTHDQKGVRLIDTERAGKIGTSDIDAETDGAFVRFDILKSPGGGPAFIRDPYVRRFGVSK